MERTINTKFYHFSQNNSGGKFNLDEDNGIAQHVVIEAIDYDDANRRAEDIGIYFNGCRKKIDCKCCGDRWNEVSEYDCNGHQSKVPTVYGKVLDDSYNDDYDCYVHYMDGTIVKYYKE
jgi:hypothetical protein